MLYADSLMLATMLGLPGFGLGLPSNSTAPHTAFVESHRGWMATGANPRHPWLYVAGFNNGVISIYDLATIGTPLVGQITGVATPNGIRLDNQGNLYVANYEFNTVTIYPPGASSPSLTLSQGLSTAVDVDVDKAGNVYVFNRGTQPNITIFAPGQTTPSGTVTSSLFAHPMALSFDSGGNLYTSDFETGVAEIAAGTQQPVSLGLRGVQRSLGIAPDPSNGRLFAFVDFGPKGSHTVAYQPGHTTTRHVLDGATSAGDFMTLGAVRGVEYLFESVYNSNQVLVYKHDSEKLLTVLSTASQNAEGVAFKPAGVP